MLICPGNPECPETATINSTTSTAINTTQGSQNISGTSGPTQSSGTSGVTVSESSGNVTTGPVRPESPRADEPPPQGIDFSKLRGPDTVVATMLLQGAPYRDAVHRAVFTQGMALHRSHHAPCSLHDSVERLHLALTMIAISWHEWSLQCS